jgi:UTP--glucose-1-phosphate uridylyltransferase
VKLLDGIRGSARRNPQHGREIPRKIRKAVLPVAGLGTRFLPVTKSLPKEMLPIVDRPLIQYAVDEALAAGIRELIFITHRSKRAIEDYFDRALEIERELESKGRHRQLAELRSLAPHHVHMAYARQSAPLGLGHAIHCARHLIGNEPFAVLLPDDLIDADPPVLSQMVERYESCGSSLIAVQTVNAAETSRYGIVDTAVVGASLARVLGIVEKPPPHEAPSDQAVVGRYIFTPRILECLDRLHLGANNEIQLTDGIARLLGHEPVFAHRFVGTRYDCGSKIGYLEATLAFAAKHAELGAEFRTLLTAAARRLQPPVATANNPPQLTLVSD